jgi:hypothetical protein
MSTVGLFLVGTFVTLIVVASLALLVWGAILDGRDEHTRKAAEHDAAELRKTSRTPHLLDAA